MKINKCKEVRDYYKFELSEAETSYLVSILYFYMRFSFCEETIDFCKSLLEEIVKYED